MHRCLLPAMRRQDLMGRFLKSDSHLQASQVKSDLKGTRRNESDVVSGFKLTDLVSESSVQEIGRFRVKCGQTSNQSDHHFSGTYAIQAFSNPSTFDVHLQMDLKADVEFCSYDFSGVHIFYITSTNMESSTLNQDTESLRSIRRLVELGKNLSINYATNHVKWCVSNGVFNKPAKYLLNCSMSKDLGFYGAGRDRITRHYCTQRNNQMESDKAEAERVSKPGNEVESVAGPADTDGYRRADDIANLSPKTCERPDWQSHVKDDFVPSADFQCFDNSEFTMNRSKIRTMFIAQSSDNFKEPQDLVMNAAENQKTLNVDSQLSIDESHVAAALEKYEATRRKIKINNQPTSRRVKSPNRRRQVPPKPVTEPNPSEAKITVIEEKTPKTPITLKKGADVKPPPKDEDLQMQKQEMDQQLNRDPNRSTFIEPEKLPSVTLESDNFRATLNTVVNPTPESWMMKKPLVDIEAFMRKRSLIPISGSEMGSCQSQAGDDKNVAAPSAEYLRLKSLMDSSNKPNSEPSINRDILRRAWQRFCHNPNRHDGDYRSASLAYDHRLKKKFDLMVDHGFVEKMKMASLKAIAEQQVADLEKAASGKLRKPFKNYTRSELFNFYRQYDFTAKPSKPLEFAEIETKKELHPNPLSENVGTPFVDGESIKQEWLKYCQPGKSTPLRTMPATETDLIEQIMKQKPSGGSVGASQTTRKSPPSGKSFCVAGDLQKKYDADTQQRIYQRYQYVNTPKINIYDSDDIEEKLEFASVPCFSGRFDDENLVSTLYDSGIQSKSKPKKKPVLEMLRELKQVNTKAPIANETSNEVIKRPVEVAEREEQLQWYPIAFTKSSPCATIVQQQREKKLLAAKMKYTPGKAASMEGASTLSKPKASKPKASKPKAFGTQATLPTGTGIKLSKIKNLKYMVHPYRIRFSPSKLTRHDDLFEVPKSPPCGSFSENWRCPQVRTKY